jgi:hypothetical protein
MCTIIVSVRSVLWAVMTIAASLMILVSLFSDRWLVGGWGLPGSLAEVESTASDALYKLQQFRRGEEVGRDRALGLFLRCKRPGGQQMGLFMGECIPKLDILEDQFYSEVTRPLLVKVDMVLMNVPVRRTMTTSLTPGREL